MKFFPTKERHFRLLSSQEETIERLKRRTDKTNQFTAWHKQQSFRGRVRRNKFEVSLNKNGGGFCILNGQINEKTGVVTIELVKGAKILIGILMLVPPIFLSINVMASEIEFNPFLIFVPIFQFLFIIAFLHFQFELYTNRALRRLQDVLDIEWIEK